MVLSVAFQFLSYTR